MSAPFVFDREKQDIFNAYWDQETVYTYQRAFYAGVDAGQQGSVPSTVYILTAVGHLMGAHGTYEGAQRAVEALVGGLTETWRQLAPSHWVAVDYQGCAWEIEECQVMP